MILGKGRLSHLDVIVIKTTAYELLNGPLAGRDIFLKIGKMILTRKWTSHSDRWRSVSVMTFDALLLVAVGLCQLLWVTNFSWMRSQLRFCDSFQLFLIKERYYILMKGISLLFTGIMFVWPYHREDLSPHQATCTQFMLLP